MGGINQVVFRVFWKINDEKTKLFRNTGVPVRLTPHFVRQSNLVVLDGVIRESDSSRSERKTADLRTNAGAMLLGGDPFWPRGLTESQRNTRVFDLGVMRVRVAHQGWFRCAAGVNATPEWNQHSGARAHQGVGRQGNCVADSRRDLLAM